MKRLIAALGITFVAAAACNASPPSEAAPLCEHRGGLHIPRHGGKLEDDRYHISRGEPVTCDTDKDNTDIRAEESHGVPRTAHEEHHDRDERHVPGHDRHRWWRND